MDFQRIPRQQAFLLLLPPHDLKKNKNYSKRFQKTLLFYE